MHRVFELAKVAMPSDTAHGIEVVVIAAFNILFDTRG